MKSQSWRVIDIVVASVLGVAVGLLFSFWNGVGYSWYEALQAVTPGLGGLAAGIWLIGGPLGGLIIRKPGAAVYVEVLAASVSAAIGNQWGIETLYSGLAQGLGAELIFLVFAYKRYGAIVAALSGIGSGVGAFILEFFLYGNNEKGLAFNLTYLTSLAITGVVLAGILAFVLMQALAKTGALDRFAAGRERSTRV
ncbi:ECF transporter S component [Corynebacterium sp. HS2168-gen11]|uniref:ECF transporter S component n=1 Tax=Corynebacterium sp. HS2168-gen11 TaxID=2974027 RepID=UPI00216AE722|nr:ECF transporter S component [Corynebacterium sp. HS2168-gen11]MCS4534947.1 ECF transporter S component [Corynebacterium sp. HS2168-gen11]